MTDSQSALSKKPSMPDYDRHIFVCVGDKCHATDGNEVYEHLKQRLKSQSSDSALCRVKRSQSKCLGVCQGGPVSVVYPEGIWYYDMTKQKMDSVIEEHLKKGQPVQDWVFYPTC